MSEPVRLDLGVLGGNWEEVDRYFFEDHQYDDDVDSVQYQDKGGNLLFFMRNDNV